MISGFNTDIEYGGTTYHVQTEDKGLASKLIVSLVYDKGTILASKRANYEDLMNGGLNESELSERLSRQHRLICAAVKAGRIDDLRKMQKRPKPDAAPVPRKPIASAPVETPVSPEPTVNLAPPPVVSETTAPIAEMPTAPPQPEPHVILESVPQAEQVPITESEIEFVLDDLIIEDVQIVEDEPIMLPDDAVAVVSELSGQSRPVNHKLSVELLGEQTFRGGERRTITLLVCRGTERKVIANAEIMIKVLGSAFRPVIFHARSDQNGLAKIHLQIPQFKAGRAALFVRAIIEGEEVELRRVVTPEV